jgi:tRNA threonylcarbamoyladenosine modification (KEOPS) complex Cgi121 subunit
MFTSKYANEKNLFLTFISNPNKDKIKSIDNRQNIIFLNSNYILNSFHVLMAVNKGFYNIKLGKTKSKEFKKEIIHCSTNENKLSDSLKIHSVEKNEENNYYVVFIDYDKNEIQNIINDLEGMEISVDNYANFLNFDNLVKHFQINEEYEINDIENGIERAIYNRIATKELK